MLGLAILTLHARAGEPERRGAPAAALPRVAENYGRLPLAFEENAGQWRGEVGFAARTSRGVVEISGNGMALRRSTEAGNERALAMRVAGSAGARRVRGERPLPGRVHYLRGSDPAAWRRNVATYAAVECEEVYPGVDLVYYGNGSELEYDFQVAPGVDPARIRLEFSGARSAEVTAAGDLVLRDVDGQELIHRRPVAYQEQDGRRRAVPASYVLEPAPSGKAPYRVAFALGDYDETRPLVIDPVVIYSTYFGGRGLEMSQAAGIAVDGEGSVYITGDTSAADLRGAGNRYGGGFRDAFVTKLNPAGTAVVYTVYLGGSDADVGRGIAVDAEGHAYVVGETYSATFPVVNAYQPTLRGFPGSDAFLAKLDPTGSSLVFSTYLGGSVGSDHAAAVALDPDGNVWVAGGTSAPDFPRVNALQNTLGGGADAFVASFTPDGSQLLFSTFLGGSGADRAAALAAGANGAIAVAGSTESSNFPLLNAVQARREALRDAFVARLAPGGGSLEFSTYLGGRGHDGATGVAIDPSGAVAVTGFTGSSDFPTVNARQPHYSGRSDAFVARFTPAGNALVYSTYLGGSGTENNAEVEGGGIAVDAEGSAFVVGFTSSRNLPVVGASQRKLGGKYDAFVARLSPDGGELMYSTYLGGKGNDLGLAIAIDPEGNAYVTGSTASKNFPTRYPAQGKRLGRSDAFVTKLGAEDAAITPLLLVKPLVLDFGTIRAGGTGIRQLRISNAGRGRLECALSPAEFPFKLAVGSEAIAVRRKKSKTLIFQFTPPEPGEYSATLELLSNDPYRQSTTIQLRGIAK